MGHTVIQNTSWPSRTTRSIAIGFGIVHVGMSRQQAKARLSMPWTRQHFFVEAARRSASFRSMVLETLPIMTVIGRF
jgi:hypothetical protein